MILILLIFLFLSSGLAEAAVYYVDSGCGNITIYNPTTRACTGGTATSRSTIQAAVNLATVAGDIVDIRVGTYAEQLTFYGINGASGNPITYRGHVGETVTIQPSGATGIDVASSSSWLVFSHLKVNGANLGNTGAPSPVGIPNITVNASTDLVFDDIESYDNGRANSARGPGAGGFINGTRVTFSNCYIHHNGAYAASYNFNGNQSPYGFYWAGSTGVVDNCRVEDNGAHGIQAYPSPSDMTIKNSTWARNGNNFYNGVGSPGQGSNSITTYGTNANIFNNVIYDSPFQIAININNTTSAVGNTIYGNGGGIAWNATVTIANNILVNNASSGNMIANGGTPTLTTNLCYGTGGTSNCQITGKDPLFTNASGGLFTLISTSSAAYNTGTPLAAPYNVDKNNNPRPLGGAWDIGAYEYTPICPSVPPALVASYSFDNDNTDSSGSGGGAATLGTGVTYTPSGKYGAGLTFTGAGGVTVADRDALDFCNGFTLEAWISVPSVSTDSMFIVKNPGSLYFMGQLAGFSPIGVAPVGGFSSTTAAFSVVHGLQITPSTLTHLALTHDGTTLTLYKNGFAVMSGAASAAVASSTGTLQFCNSGYGELCPSGTILDEVRLYNYARSPAEIVSDMNTPITPIPSIVLQLSNSNLKIGPGVTLKFGVP